MSVEIAATFIDDDGVKAIGLVPTIIITEISLNQIVVSDIMTEVGNGAYKYLFETVDLTKDYTFICDAGSSLLSRYVPGVISFFGSATLANQEALLAGMSDLYSDVIQIKEYTVEQPPSTLIWHSNRYRTPGKRYRLEDL